MPSTYDWNNYLLINFFYLTSDFALTQKKTLLENVQIPNFNV